MVNERISWKHPNGKYVSVRIVFKAESREQYDLAHQAARPPGSEVDAVADSCPAEAAPEHRAPRPAVVRDLGRQAYEPVWRAMQRFTDQRSDNDADELWVVEHDPVFTLGQAGGRARAGTG